MICGKCDSGMVMYEEIMTEYGLGTSLVCKKCGQTGRYGWKEKTMSKKGICENCKRGPMVLVAHGLCGSCYTAQHGLEGEKREKALAAAAERYAGKAVRKTKPIMGTGPQKAPAELSPPHDPPGKLTPGPHEKPVPAELSSMLPPFYQETNPGDNTGGPPHNITRESTADPAFTPVSSKQQANRDNGIPPIEISFTDDDAPIYSWLINEARRDRRTPDQHILHMIDYFYSKRDE